MTANMSKSTVEVNKWVLLSGIVFACAAIVAVGLGVYYGTRPSSDNEANTEAPPLTTTKKTIPTPPPAENIRLPTNLMPSRYELLVKTYLPSPDNVVTYDANKNFTIEGSVNISMTCNQDTTVIVMHMSLITIDNSTLKLVDDTGTILGINGYTYDDDSQEVTFQINTTLKSGINYTLSIGYEGLLNGDMRGFYRSSYYENNQLNWLAVTQFEPTDARRALPCFDEPSFKAKFDVTIIHPNDMKALSNGMELGSTPMGNNWTETHFNETPTMSTYLLAMCVARFENMSKMSNQNVLFRVWARPSFIADAWYAVEAGPKVLDFYAEYFNISFPLVKQDMVALPDFAAGAMENWGMVTYRERDLLYHNGTYAATNLQRTATVIAHELAHQWFGDLVTLDWWDDLWLNEGFAEFMEYKGVNIISNFSMNMNLQFTPLEIDLAMQEDQLVTSHPLYDPSLQNPDQIFAAFDDIAYDKGASVIHILEKVVGEKVFVQGLRKYLTTNEYGNANHQDLWNAMQWAVDENNITGWDSTENLDVTAFLNPWVEQMGFPVVNAIRQYNPDSSVIVLTQQRFVLPGNFTGNYNYSHPEFNFTWYIDTSIIASSPNKNDNLTIWLTPDLIPYNVESYDNSDWIIVNAEMRDYFRTNYDMKNWNMLRDQLLKNYTAIDTRNRAQLLDDALNLARANMLSYEMALNLTEYLYLEMNYVPWASVTSSFSYFNDMFALTSDYQYFGKYMQLIMTPVYNTLTWNDTMNPYQDVLIHELRQFIIQSMCQIENENCSRTAQSYFQKFKTGCQSTVGTSNCANAPPANVRKAVYCTGVAQGTVDDFNYMYAKYPEEQVAVERDNLLYGLCCSKNPYQLMALLNQAINPSSSFIRQQDSQYVFTYVSTNQVGREILWGYFVDNWEQISQLFSSGFFSLGTIIQGATRSFNTAEQIQEMTDFLNDNLQELGTGTSTFYQQLEVAENNQQWMETNAATVIQWFKDHTDSS